MVIVQEVGGIREGERFFAPPMPARHAYKASGVERLRGIHTGVVRSV